MDGAVDGFLDGADDGEVFSVNDSVFFDGVGVNGSGPSFTLNIVPTKRTAKINTNRVIVRVLNTFERSISVGDIQ